MEERKLRKIIGYLLLQAFLVSCCVGFNFDTINFIQHEGRRDSMFGFSIALHEEGKRSMIIVGAPKDDTSHIQQDVINGGAVHRCDIFDDNRCQLIAFDRKGNNRNEENQQVDTKSNQWFGATVHSSGPDGSVIACAPRYVYHTTNPLKVERNEPVGTCWLAKDNFNVIQEYSPCRTAFWGYHRQGSCQAGMSAAVSKNSSRIFIGAPGSWYWQGAQHSIGLSMDDKTVWSTKESGNANEDDSYMGYSSVSGDFTGNGVDGVAVGMPRGGNLMGKVLIFTENLTNERNITGEQIGAYFGYSLAVADLDGDGLQDLLVGSPMYTEPNNEGKYENGRVYIIYQGRNHKFNEVETRDGKKSRARFGIALSSLGDLNLDGLDDFAVGAPYDGPNGRGAVYIYMSKHSERGPCKNPSQIIFAEDVAGNYYLNTFGFSISGGLDLDKNRYPDLAVGAYDANKVFFFRARPVIVMDANTSFVTGKYKLIALDDRRCKLPGVEEIVPCVKIHSCLTYNGVNLPREIDMEVSWTLDSRKQRNPRLFYISNDKNVKVTLMRLQRGIVQCRTDDVYLILNPKDKLTPLEVEMKYKLPIKDNISKITSRRQRRGILEPILDQNDDSVQRDSINIQKNCGHDNICIPDLRLDVQMIKNYLLGSKDILYVNVTVTNYGEDAFESNFFMQIPNSFEFRKVEKNPAISCEAPKFENNNTLKCEVGNPLQGGRLVNFSILLAPNKSQQYSSAYNFFMNVNSTNKETPETEFDNLLKKTVEMWIKTQLSITGTSKPNEFHYNVSQFKALENASSEHDIGPQVVTIYNIGNNEASQIEEVEVSILIPYETNDALPLMYVLNEPEIHGNIRCDPSDHINYKFLKIDEKLAKQSYLRLDNSDNPIKSKGITVSSAMSGSTSLGHFGLSSSSQNIYLDENVPSSGDASQIHLRRSQSPLDIVLNNTNEKSLQPANFRVNNKVPQQRNNIKPEMDKFNDFEISVNPAFTGDTVNKGNDSYKSSRRKMKGYQDNFLDYNQYEDAHQSINIENTKQLPVPHATYSNKKFRFYDRYRRSQSNENQLAIKEQCNNVKCAIIRCYAGPLGINDNAFIAIRSRLSAITMSKIASSAAMNISTLILAKIMRLPYIGTPKDETIKIHEVKIHAIPEPEPKPDVVPLWIVVLAAIIGALLLLLLIYIMYKCGFFKRNRPHQTSQVNVHERQPLNGSNGYHNDEHL